MQRLQVPATVENLDVINAYIDEVVPDQFLPLVGTIKLAAEEFFVNIYSYAYSDTTGTVEMQCGEKAGDTPGIFLLIKDWGPPFNPFEEAKNPDITLDVDSRPVGGLGVYLIRQMSQSQQYRREDGANIIEIFFSLPQVARPSPSPVLGLLLAFCLACPGVLYAQNTMPGTILSDERETVMVEAIPVTALARLPVREPQAADKAQIAEQAAQPAPPQSAVSATTENLLHGMDVYALSPHARFLSSSHRGTPWQYGVAHQFTSGTRPVLGAGVEIWADSIAAAGRIHDLPESLIAAVIRTESAFNPTALSSKGAQGLMQIMPETQRSLGLVDPYNPEANIMAGSRYLREQLNTFGTLELALAAYNAGPGNVQRHGGIPPFAETRAFVSKVLSYME